MIYSVRAGDIQPHLLNNRYLFILPMLLKTYDMSELLKVQIIILFEQKT